MSPIFQSLLLVNYRSFNFVKYLTLNISKLQMKKRRVGTCNNWNHGKLNKLMTSQSANFPTFRLININQLHVFKAVHQRIITFNLSLTHLKADTKSWICPSWKIFHSLVLGENLAGRFVSLAADSQNGGLQVLMNINACSCLAFSRISSPGNYPMSILDMEIVFSSVISWFPPNQYM